MSNSDIADQATGYLAVFVNGNGNVSLCQIVFCSLKQAQEWAVNALKERGFSKPRTTRSAVMVQTKSGDEFGYELIPVVHADTGRKGGSISSDHIATIR